MRLRPLSERVLSSGGAPRVVLLLVWALIPWLNAGANLLLDAGERSAVWEQSTAVVILNYSALTLAIVVTLLGAERIARRAETLEPTASRLFVGAPKAELFREMNSIRGPLIATTATAVAFTLTAFVEDSWKAAVLRGATWFVLGIPLWSFLWSYASLQLGLHRLGQARLRDDASVVVDPSLALRPFGAAAFAALSLLLVSIVPVVVTGLPDVTGFVIGLLVLGGGLAAFVFSLWGLHRQIVDVKESLLAHARELYAEAYEPLRKERTLGTLERQHSLLGAADSLEKRARAIHDWPVREGTWAWVIGIATSVVAIACSRLLLRGLGF